MADDENRSPHNRRSSFAGQTFADLFGTSRNTRPSAADSTPASQFPITAAAAQAHQQRRLSIATLGLSGSPNATTSPFGSLRGMNRRDSLSSANSGSLDESAIEDDNAAALPAVTPTNPFVRRMSFGARAMQSIHSTSNGGGRGGGGTSPNGQNNGEGFNWSDNLRSRAERSSIAAPTGATAFGSAIPNPSAAHHSRAQSVATMEPPVREAPRPVAQKPDHFQERILKGDFYMD